MSSREFLQKFRKHECMSFFLRKIESYIPYNFEPNKNFKLDFFKIFSFILNANKIYNYVKKKLSKFIKNYSFYGILNIENKIFSKLKL